MVFGHVIRSPLILLFNRRLVLFSVETPRSVPPQVHPSRDQGDRRDHCPTSRQESRSQRAEDVSTRDAQWIQV